MTWLAVLRTQQGGSSILHASLHCAGGHTCTQGTGVTAGTHTEGVWLFLHICPGDFEHLSAATQKIPLWLPTGGVTATGKPVWACLGTVAPRGGTRLNSEISQAFLSAFPSPLPTHLKKETTRLPAVHAKGKRHSCCFSASPLPAIQGTRCDHTHLKFNKQHNIKRVSEMVT